jgi:hypothetical protein
MIKQLQQVNWKEIPGYAGLYLISEFGNIYNTKTSKFLVPRRPRKTKEPAYINLSFNGNVSQLSINKLLTELYGNT